MDTGNAGKEKLGRQKRQLQVFGHVLELDEHLVQRYEHAYGVDGYGGRIDGSWLEIELEDSPVYQELRGGNAGIDTLAAETERMLRDIAEGYEEFSKNVKERCKGGLI